MRKALTLTVALALTIGAAVAQSNTASTRSDANSSKATMKMTESSAKADAQVEGKAATAQRMDVNGQQKAVKMTDEYIDGKIAELKKAIAENSDNKDFNLIGHRNRIQYLESRRPE